MAPTPKFLMILGASFFVGGLLWHFGILQYLRLGHLPGDISIEREHTRIYIPITTCIVLSVVLSLLMRLFRS